jgi:hypothetical protein
LRYAKNRDSRKKVKIADVGEEMVVWVRHKDVDRCARCATEISRGMLILINCEEGIRCLKCAGMADLVFLPSGDPALTRRAMRLSPRTAVVVKFSRARKRNERQGVRVEETALRQAQEECRQDAARRGEIAVRRRARDAVREQEYVERFRARILEFFPHGPPAEAIEIAKHACAKHSGRVGRTAWAKERDPRAIELATTAHVRHRHTDYDELLAEGDRTAARWSVEDRVREILRRRRG